MTDEGIALEYEIFLATEGKVLKECHKCGTTTHRDECPQCNIRLTGDSEADAIFERLEAGEDVDLNLLKARKDEWEPIVFTQREA